MDIISEKRWKFVPVTDLEIVYLGGSTDQVTFGALDRFIDAADRIEVVIRDEKGVKTVEEITCLKRNMLSYRTRLRLLRLEDRTPLPVDVPLPFEEDDPSAV